MHEVGENQLEDIQDLQDKLKAAEQEIQGINNWNDPNTPKQIGALNNEIAALSEEIRETDSNGYIRQTNEDAWGIEDKRVPPEKHEFDLEPWGPVWGATVGVAAVALSSGIAAGILAELNGHLSSKADVQTKFAAINDAFCNLKSVQAEVTG